MYSAIIKQSIKNYNNLKLIALMNAEVRDGMA